MTTEILRTQRLALRQLTQDDLPALCETLQDAQAMAAWGHAFSLDEARAWLDKDVYKRQALADDSGLCVDALGGAPGVHSALSLIHIS